MENYNGWTNYATWRVNLEMFDGGEWQGYTAADFKEMAEESMEQEAKGLALSYALAFLSDVDWDEIAAHYGDDIRVGDDPDDRKYTTEEIAEQAWVDERIDRMKEEGF